MPRAIRFIIFALPLVMVGAATAWSQVSAPPGGPQSPGADLLEGLAQQAYLKASNTETLDAFGGSVAVSGDTLVIGVTGDDSGATGVNGDQTDGSAPGSGAAFVYLRTGSTWTQQAYLKASNTGAIDAFGTSVAISGDTIVVGARFEASAATGVNGNQADDSHPTSGAAYVFLRNGTTWTQQAYLKASNSEGITAPATGDQFGGFVAISGDTLVVGAIYEKSDATGVNGDEENNNAVFSGAAYVFVRNGTTWSQQAYLKASNTDSGDQFGSSVSMCGDVIVIGAPLEQSRAAGVNGDESSNAYPAAGASYVFVRTDSAWSQQAYLKASNTEAVDMFGSSVSVSGETVVVGALGEDSQAKGVDGEQNDDSLTNAGAAYVFVRKGTTWSQQAYFKSSSPDSFDLWGTAVAVSGDLVLVGSAEEDGSGVGFGADPTDNGASSAGAVHAFVRYADSWFPRAYLKASNSGVGDLFGRAVGVSGNTVVVGAPVEASSSTAVDGDQDDNGAPGAGAAYVLEITPELWTDLGGGSPGVDGVPQLVGSGPLTAGSLNPISLTNAPPRAFMLVWIALAPTPFPALGGTVWAHPFNVQLLVVADASGAFRTGVLWPPGIPPGTQTWFQFLVQDRSSVHGITLSNGVLATTP